MVTENNDTMVSARGRTIMALGVGQLHYNVEADAEFCKKHSLESDCTIENKELIDELLKMATLDAPCDMVAKLA